jgi:AraC family transcriptional regulator
LTPHADRRTATACIDRREIGEAWLIVVAVRPLAWASSMNAQTHSAFARSYAEGRLASCVQATRSPGKILDILEAAQPAGEVLHPAVPELVLVQTLASSGRTSGDIGWGRFDVKPRKGTFFLAAPDFGNTVSVGSSHTIRYLSFPLAQWQAVFDEAVDGKLSMESLQIDRGVFESANIRSAIGKLWALSDDEGAPSRLLARSAGCEILAELCRLSGASMAPAKGGLAPWIQRRCFDYMHAKMSEDVSLEDLAAEAQLSQFHFARMFKQSVGVPPRVYLTRIRMEKACELLEKTDLPVTQIAFDVGYASNQAFARVFLKERSMTPTAYRRAVLGPVRSESEPYPFPRNLQCG